MFDKHRNKAKKFQSTASTDIKVGAEVRTKSNPVYAANSIAVNLQSSVPMVRFNKYQKNKYTYVSLFQIGVMMESAWTLTETCRFRIYTPEQFDQLKDDPKGKDDKKAINCKFFSFYTFSNTKCWCCFFRSIFFSILIFTSLPRFGSGRIFRILIQGSKGEFGEGG